MYPNISTYSSWFFFPRWSFSCNREWQNWNGNCFYGHFFWNGISYFGVWWWHSTGMVLAIDWADSMINNTCRFHAKHISSFFFFVLNSYLLIYLAFQFSCNQHRVIQFQNAHVMHSYQLILVLYNLHAHQRYYPCS